MMQQTLVGMASPAAEATAFLESCSYILCSVCATRTSERSDQHVPAPPSIATKKVCQFVFNARHFKTNANIKNILHSTQ